RAAQLALRYLAAEVIHVRLAGRPGPEAIYAGWGTRSPAPDIRGESASTTPDLRALRPASTPDPTTPASSAASASRPAPAEVIQTPFSSRIADTVQVGMPSSTRNHPVKWPRSSRPAVVTPSPSSTKNNVHMMAQVAQITANTGSDPTDFTAWNAAIAATNALYQPNPLGSRSKIWIRPNHR